MTTSKKRMSLYLAETAKEDIEALAKVRKRSVSNLIEILIEEAIEVAKKTGELPS